MYHTVNNAFKKPHFKLQQHNLLNPDVSQLHMNIILTELHIYFALFWSSTQVHHLFQKLISHFSEEFSFFSNWQVWIQMAVLISSRPQMFFKVYQNSRENNCAGVSLGDSNFNKTETPPQVFPCELYEGRIG